MSADWGRDGRPALEETEPQLPHALPNGLPDSLYETDASTGLPRAMRLLPDPSRAYRRRLAKMMRPWMRRLSNEYRESLDDNRVVMWFLEERLLAGTYWAITRTPGRAGEAPLPPSLELVLLERVASEYAEMLEPFTEAGMEAHCSVWRRMRDNVELGVDEPFHMMAPRGKALLMLWPIVRDALLDPALSLESDRARELIEAVFALSSITFDNWFVNAVCAVRPELGGSFSRFIEQPPPGEALDDEEIDEWDDDEIDDDDSDEDEDAFLPYLPRGLADSLYERDEHGVPRALRLLPDSSRAQRRRLARELRRQIEQGGASVPAEVLDNDVETIMAVIEGRGMAAAAFWVAVADAVRRADVFFVPSLELALLQRECARHRAVIKPFDEAMFSAEGGPWRSIARDIERGLRRKWRKLARAGLDLLMVWPALRDELVDPGLDVPSERARDALEGVFALSSATMSPYFINEVCRLRPDLCDAFMELEDRFLMEDAEADEEAAAEDAGEVEDVWLDVDVGEPPRSARAAEVREADGSAAAASVEGLGETEPVTASSGDALPPAVAAAEPVAAPEGADNAVAVVAAPEAAALERATAEAVAGADRPAAVERIGQPARKLAAAKAPEVRPVVQVVCELGGDDPAAAIQAAREEVLAWLTEKGVQGMHEKAKEGAAFEIDASEGLPVTVESSDRVWALRFDTPDSAVAGRLWRTEVILGTLEQRALVGIRLTTISPRAGVPVRWSVPRVLRRLVARPGLRDYGARLMDYPWRIETATQVDALVQLLEQPARNRRVYVLSEDSSGDTLLDGTTLARRLAGLAHVVSLSPQAAGELSARVGEGLGVYGRAMRTYSPGLVCGSGASADHPLALETWVADRFESPDAFIDLLERRAIEDSVRGDLEATLPSFSRVRNWANARRLEEARRDVTTDADLLALYVESNETMTNELRDRDATIERLRLEQLQFEEERDEAVRESRELRGRIEFLEQALTARGIEETVEYPSSYDEVELWVAQHFADRLTLLPRAVRSLKKAVFGNLPLVCDCLKLLAGPYRDMKRGGLTRAAFDEACAHLGVMLTQSGQASAGRYDSEYTVTLGKERRVLDLHLKRGTSRDASKCLRVYFLYDSDRDRVVVGHLPGHLRTMVG